MGSPTRRWRRSFERFDRTLGFLIGAIVGFVLVFIGVAADGSTSRQALEAGAVGAVAFGLVCALFGDRAAWVLVRRAARGRSLALPLLALLVATALGCGDRPPRPPVRAAEPPVKAVPSEWFAVDEVELSSLDEERIGHVCSSPPTLLTRHELEIPPGHPFASSGGVVFVEAIVGTGGRIAKARLLRDDESPELRENLVRCLRRWEYRLPTHQGVTLATTQVIVFEFHPGERRSRPPRRRGA